MIDWSKEKVFEPILTCSLSVLELENIRDAQGFEMQVKEASRAASMLAGFEARNGVFRAIGVSRKKIKKFETYKDFANNIL